MCYHRASTSLPVSARQNADMSVQITAPSPSHSLALFLILGVREQRMGSAIYILYSITTLQHIFNVY